MYAHIYHIFFQYAARSGYFFLCLLSFGSIYMHGVFLPCPYLLPCIQIHAKPPWFALSFVSNSAVLLFTFVWPHFYLGQQWITALRKKIRSVPCRLLNLYAAIDNEVVPLSFRPSSLGVSTRQFIIPAAWRPARILFRYGKHKRTHVSRRTNQF